MSFVSYAQNLEDVVLWRALGRVEQGFYIDAGAAWPDLHSVTRAFYLRGWRGINIEPCPNFHSQLCADRPRDVNLQCALADADGVARLVVFTGTGLSTIVETVAQEHIEANRDYTVVDVPVSTLTSVWAEHVPEQQEVHFLKIDVEGCEAQIIEGSDWTRCRPWIVLVESTHPLSQIPSHAAWEPVLLEAGYLFAYADGLNRFYVDSGHSELMEAFRFPPNVFDGFTTSSEVHALESQRQSESQAARAMEAVQIAEARRVGAGQCLLEAEMRVARLESMLRLAQERNGDLEQQLQAVKASRSWRVTRPLRTIVTQGEKARSLLRWLCQGKDRHRSAAMVEIAEEKFTEADQQIEAPVSPSTARQARLEKIVAGELDSLRRGLH